MSEGYRYPPERRGWTCYHCDETFTTWGEAEDHFGKTPEAKPGCLIKVQYGDERGLEMELRKREAEVVEWKQRAELLELVEKNRLCVVPPNQETPDWSVYAKFDGEFGYDNEIGTGATLIEALEIAATAIADVERRC